MRASFSERELNSYVKKLTSSGAGLHKLNVEMEFKKAEPWDGKDAQYVEEEDYTEYDEL